MNSIYKKIRDDFGFISEYGYCYIRDGVHRVHPSVTFGNGEYNIGVNYYYDENKFHISVYDLSKDKYFLYDNSEHLLDSVVLSGKSYKDQVEQVKEIVRNYLQEKHK